MASHQYRPPNSPITEHAHEGEDSPDGSSSFCFCFQWWVGMNYRHRPLLDGDDGRPCQQWSAVVKEKLMKVREATEVAAGPKWKTFIRRAGGCFGKNRRTDRAQFGYDSESYALNFDGGFDREDEDCGVLMYNARSARFTGPSSASSNEQNRGIL